MLACVERRLQARDVKPLDRYLRNRRIKLVREFLNPGSEILDIGCADGAMFEQLKDRYKYGYGVEPTLGSEIETDSYHLFPGGFPEALPADVSVDLVTMLAVLEHLPPEAQSELAKACHSILKPAGRVVISVPSPRVDDLLHVLGRLRLIDGMSMHEHYGFEPLDTLTVFAEPAFKLVEHRKFQFGLNNLFVFEKA